MKLLKHVGKHNNKKVVVLWKEIPNVSDMCLLIYTELLPRQYHDDLIRTLESPQGQEAKELNEVLHRTLMNDGRNLLNVLHREGWIKKAPTNQVIITPTPQSSVRLDELNNLLRKMTDGADAVKRMAELDSQSGVKDPKKNIAQDTATATPVASDYISDVVTDDMLAKQRTDQAKKMRAEAKGLIAEAQRLELEAKDLTKAKAATTDLKKTKSDGRKKKETATSAA